MFLFLFCVYNLISLFMLRVSNVFKDNIEGRLPIDFHLYYTIISKMNVEDYGKLFCYL